MAIVAKSKGKKVEETEQRPKSRSTQLEYLCLAGVQNSNEEAARESSFDGSDKVDGDISLKQGFVRCILEKASLESQVLGKSRELEKGERKSNASLEKQGDVIYGPSPINGPIIISQDGSGLNALDQKRCRSPDKMSVQNQNKKYEAGSQVERAIISGGFEGKLNKL
ncbi:hypothetical protein ACFE04_018538 [Oxalis oulophora]